MFRKIEGIIKWDVLQENMRHPLQLIQVTAHLSRGVTHLPGGASGGGHGAPLLGGSFDGIGGTFDGIGGSFDGIRGHLSHWRGETRIKINSSRSLLWLLFIFGLLVCFRF